MGALPALYQPSVDPVLKLYKLASKWELFPALYLPSVDSVFILNKLSSRWVLFPALYLISVDPVLTLHFASCHNLPSCTLERFTVFHAEITSVFNLLTFQHVSGFFVIFICFAPLKLNLLLLRTWVSFFDLLPEKILTTGFLCI